MEEDRAETPRRPTSKQESQQARPPESVRDFMNPQGPEPERTTHALAPPPDPVPRLPEDVAILYAWANIPGATYRDFSAAREERRRLRRTGTPQNPIPHAIEAPPEAPIPAPEFSGYRTVYRPAVALKPRPPANVPEPPLQLEIQEEEAGPAWLYEHATPDRRERSPRPSVTAAPGGPSAPQPPDSRPPRGRQV